MAEGATGARALRHQPRASVAQPRLMALVGLRSTALVGAQARARVRCGYGMVRGTGAGTGDKDWAPAGRQRKWAPVGMTASRGTTSVGTGARQGMDADGDRGEARNGRDRGLACSMILSWRGARNDMDEAVN